MGKAMRATGQNAEVALVCGIDVARIRLLTFGLGTAMAAAAGSLLLAIMYTVYPEMGHTFLLKAFAIIVLGGMGSFGGAFLGALRSAWPRRWRPTSGPPRSRRPSPTACSSSCSWPARRACSAARVSTAHRPSRPRASGGPD